MPSPQPDLDLLTPADAARILALSVDMVRVLADNGQLATAARTMRGARLFRRDDVEELAATRAGKHVRHHSVQFYEGDEHLARVVAGFVSDGLRGAAPGVIIATQARCASFVEHLRARGVDADAALRSRQLLLLDAQDTLASFMTGDGGLDEARFKEHVGGALERSRRAWPRGRLRAYGEMVDLLWRENRRHAAIELEEMWNRLATVQPFSLLCGYAMSNFPAGADAGSFDRVCAAHTRVIPTESFHQDEGVDSRHREIARLQQRARALENELRERMRSEDALRKAKEGG